ncbi:hypothetical protein Plim_0318 [Planctopirus limnophila DSM 3776]|uniref:Transmembrane protein n=1 Tax=Planctopirus limnophila (strain ATCC 43296 / DSM 3776 / IFAM 1008 / Mu 290) TaxID=521674 RepID=D5SP14_PLAL2|nr:hypothetical protein [Planctopirus limnophila]ADG66169.1 hypothetical protein Plim_0318 [Planctopirus limnophila DSM 3776]
MSRIPALVAGVLLVLTGAALLLHAWGLSSENPGNSKAISAQQKRARRRIQIAALIILEGLLIPAGDLWMEQRPAAVLMAAFWIGVLLIALWIGLLAVADFFSSRAMLHFSLEQLKEQQRVLQQQVDAHRSRKTTTSSTAGDDADPGT